MVPWLVQELREAKDGQEARLGAAVAAAEDHARVCTASSPVCSAKSSLGPVLSYPKSNAGCRELRPLLACA